jgi:predicted lactoylglutathione lyase
MTAMHSVLVTLPVRNPRVSAAFFAGLGFAIRQEAAGQETVCLDFGPGVQVLLLGRERFRDLISGEVGQEGTPGEVLTSLTASSEQEVDEIVARAIAAGGKPWPIMEERPVYSGSFQDLDGHLWQVVCPPQ